MYAARAARHGTLQVLCRGMSPVRCGVQSAARYAGSVTALCQNARTLRLIRIVRYCETAVALRATVRRELSSNAAWVHACTHLHLGAFCGILPFVFKRFG